MNREKANKMYLYKKPCPKTASNALSNVLTYAM